MPALQYLVAENSALAISAELIIRFEAILAGIGVDEVLVEVLFGVLSKLPKLFVRFCNDAAYDGGSGSLPLVKLAVKLGGNPGARLFSMLLAAARLSKLLAPNGIDMFAVPSPRAMLVSISSPVGYDGGKVGVVDFDEDLEEVGKTGMFSCGVSNL